MQATKLRKLPRPFAYKNLHDLSDEQRKRLENAVWGGLKQALDHEHCPVLHFNALSSIDRLFEEWFHNGQDISPITSLADWSDFSFKAEQSIDKLLKLHQGYHAKREEGFFNLDNATTFIENFMIFSEIHPQDGFREHVFRQWLDITTQVYCHYYNTAQISKADKSLQLFFQSLQQLNKTWAKDAAYSLRISFETVALCLENTKKIDSKHDILEYMLDELRPQFSNLWRSLDFLVKKRFFMIHNMQGDKFKVALSLLESLPREELIASIMHDIRDQQWHAPAYREKIIYFLQQNWSLLNSKDIASLCDYLFTGGSTDRVFEEARKLFSTIDDVATLHQLFQSNHFDWEIRSKPQFIECAQLVERKMQAQYLEHVLPANPDLSKIRKL